MELVKIRKSIEELSIGMYVCELDCSWTGTPFLMQGFAIDCKEDITQISHYCKFVYIDAHRSKAEEEVRRSVPQRKLKSVQEIFPQRTLKAYPKTTSWRAEAPAAQLAANKLQTTAINLFEGVREDTPFNMVEVKHSVSNMIDSVVRNPDSSMWLTRLKDKDSYIYDHSVSCSIWAVAMGRQMGLPKHDLKTLATAALLFDVGKLKLPNELLRKTTRITEEERKLLDSHVNEGVNVLRLTNGVNNDVIGVVKYHHERWDGSGYPKGLVGESIPILARIIGIVDCYDAMTSERAFASASSPSLVVRKLYAWRDKLFQAELVEEFIKAVGLYPAGTLVQLSTKEIAVVTAEVKENRLRPNILILLDQDKNPLPQIKAVNLSEMQKNNEGKSLNISKSLEPGAFGIDTRTINL